MVEGSRSRYQGGANYRERSEESLIYLTQFPMPSDQEQEMGFEQHETERSPSHIIDESMTGYDAYNTSGQEVTLASKDSLALQPTYRPRVEEVPTDEPGNLQHKLPGESKKKKMRDLILAAFCVALIMGLMIFGIVFSRVRVRQDSVVEEGPVVEAVEAQRVVTASPSYTPTSPPTESIRQSAEFQIISPYYEDPSVLLDPAAPQGVAFQQILNEGRSDPFRILQRYSLFVVYHSMGGDEWKWNHGWEDAAEDECDWMGVTICRMQDHGSRAVSGIDLDSNGLVGSFPNEICFLTEIESIVLRDNEIEGELPACLTAQAELKELDVAKNRLSGGLPKGLFAMPSLQSLIISDNDFDGNLKVLLEGSSTQNGVRRTSGGQYYPAFRRLKVLEMKNNHFEDEIPPAIFFLSHLKKLTLHGNSLKGNLDTLCTHQLNVLTADCVNVTCTCCTQCF